MCIYIFNLPSNPISQPIGPLPSLFLSPTPQLLMYNIYQVNPSLQESPQRPVCLSDLGNAPALLFSTHIPYIPYIPSILSILSIPSTPRASLFHSLNKDHLIDYEN